MFLAIWEKLKTKTTYRVRYDTEELIRNAGQAIKNLPKIEKPSVHSIKNEVVITSSGIASQYKGDRISTGQSDYVIPDMLGYIQRHTELTRNTIMRIIAESGRINDLAVNPQLFMDLAIASCLKIGKPIRMKLRLRYRKGTRQFTTISFRWILLSRIDLPKIASRAIK